METWKVVADTKAERDGNSNFLFVSDDNHQRKENFHTHTTIIHTIKIPFLIFPIQLLPFFRLLLSLLFLCLCDALFDVHLRRCSMFSSRKLTANDFEWRFTVFFFLINFWRLFTVVCILCANLLSILINMHKRLTQPRFCVVFCVNFGKEKNNERVSDFPYVVFNWKSH